MKQTAPETITDHYKVTMRSDGTICVITCRYCLRQFKAVDNGGRRNWIGAMTHTMRHVNEVLRRRAASETDGAKR
jgi:hypothetical protein